MIRVPSVTIVTPEDGAVLWGPPNYRGENGSVPGNLYVAFTAICSPEQLVSALAERASEYNLTVPKRFVVEVLPPPPAEPHRRDYYLIRNVQLDQAQWFHVEVPHSDLPWSARILLLNSEGTVLCSGESRFFIKPAPPREPTAPMRVLGVHPNHDANVAVVEDGVVLGVLELERYFDVRYCLTSYRPPYLFLEFAVAIEMLFGAIGLDRDSWFDVASAITDMGPKTDWVLGSIGQLVRARRVESVDHHRAHAVLSFYDSKFEDGLIFSIDGGGNDGTFNIYSARRTGDVSDIVLASSLPLNLGKMYATFATHMEEVRPPNCCDFLQFLGLAGKAMAYEALGTVRPEWKDGVRRSFMETLEHSRDMAPALGMTEDELIALSQRQAKDLAATSQHVFKTIVIEQVLETLKTRAESGQPVRGVVLVGGCALNVKLNEELQERLGRDNIPVWVPAAPNDCGLSIGAAWLQRPPDRDRWHSLAFVGMEAWDIGDLARYESQRATSRLDVPKTAALLANGHMLALMRGRQEHGPRALGHRSLLFYPDKPDSKDRINRLKRRQWYRPVAPMVAEGFVGDMFVTERVSSPYMSFAPQMRPDIAERFPAIRHFDNTGRIQTVSEDDEAWVHALLKALAKLTGYPILANTSFNIKGKPIVNRVDMAIEMLDEEEGIDYLMVEEVLFYKNTTTSEPDPPPWRWDGAPSVGSAVEPVFSV